MKLKEKNSILRKGYKKKPKLNWANLQNPWPKSWNHDYPIERKHEKIMKQITTKTMRIKSSIKIK